MSKMSRLLGYSQHSNLLCVLHSSADRATVKAFSEVNIDGKQREMMYKYGIFGAIYFG